MFKKLILLGSSVFILTACNNNTNSDNGGNEVVETTSGDVVKNITEYDNVVVIKSANEADDLLKKDGDIFIYVSQAGCKYCEMVEPAMNEAIRGSKDLTIYYIDASEFIPSKEFMKKTAINSTPWFIRMEDGNLKSTYLFDENTKAHEISLWLMS